jgi:hypothetical protein
MTIGAFPINCLENSKENLEKIISGNKSELNALLAQSVKTYKNFVRPYMDSGERINSFLPPYPISKVLKMIKIPKRRLLHV